ncbi:hypothetical protein DFQ30_010450 [Apophysomyces sp. BC1015]|nr:hypothetical protein DFQ30_010450 [Apophysomyces sp. BC1015]
MQPVRPREHDSADRLRVAAAVRAGDAGDRQRELCAAVTQCAFGHRACDWLADRAVALDHVARHADHFGDEPPLEPAAAAGDVGDCRGDHAAGARLRGDEHQPLVAQSIADANRKLGEPPIVVSYHTRPCGVSERTYQCDDEQREKRRNDIVEHDAEAAREPSVEIAYRRRLDHVEETEHDECAELSDEVRRCDEQQHQPDRNDLVPDHRAGILHAHAPRGEAGEPASGDKADDNQYPPLHDAQIAVQCNERQPSKQRTDRARHHRRQATAEAER